MRYCVRYNNKAETWEVVDILSARQTVGRHRQQILALVQAESEERRWRRFGPGIETFALTTEVTATGSAPLLSAVASGHR